jgi:hypothetical protein
VGVSLQRHLGVESEMLHGQFTVNTESGRAAIKCPLCGLVFTLPSHCRVEPDGRAVPAVSCPQVMCPFMEYVTLADIWSEYP